ncbi:MAG: hypothetical protein GF408_02825 [Candidatus Omnitrophica bacterium]|nr:hypothetical protein [Candidatus Omnitrophota bacterium]
MKRLMKTLIAVENEQEARRALVWTRENPEAEPLFVGLSEEARSCLEDAGFPVKRESDFLSDAACADIVSKGWEKANRWFLSPEAREELLFKGVNLGEAYSLQLNKYFAWFTKMRMLAEKMIEKSSFDKVLLIGSEGEHRSFTLKPSDSDRLINALLEDICGFRKIPFEKVMCDLPERVPEAREPLEQRAKSAVKSILYGSYSILRGKNKDRGAVVFFSGLGNVRDIILKLRKRTKRPIVFLDLDPQLENMLFCARSGVSYRVLKRGPGPRGDYGEVLSDEVFRAFAGVDGLVLEHALSGRFERFRKCAAVAKKMVSDTLAFLEDIGPSRVVLDQDMDEIKKTFTLAARNSGIRTDVICHGIPPRTHAVGSTPLTADGLIVGGEGTLGIYAEAGVDPARIRVLGDPRYDAIAGEAPEMRRGGLKERLGLRDSDRLIVFALAFLTAKGGWFYRESVTDRFKASIEYVCRVLSGAPGNPFVVLKAHPRVDDEQFGMYKDAAERSGLKSRCVCLRKENMLELISSADLVVSHWSNVCVESAFLGKPCIVVDFLGEADAYDTVSDGAGLKASDEESFSRAMDILPEKDLSGGYDAVRKKYGNGLTGKAAVNIVEYLLREEDEG